MATILPFTRAASTNPLKSSAPLGAALAFLGVEGSVPLFHGSQGCTSFALVLMVRHFKETIPLQTTAMDEVSTILGGADHLEEAILNLKNRTKAKFIGVCTTALVETRGEDFAGDLALIRAKRAADLGDTVVALAQTPDFTGSLEEGFAAATTAIVDSLVPKGRLKPVEGRIALFPGSHLTIADIDHLRDLADAFGLDPILAPDLSGSLDGTVKEAWVPTSYGGTPIERIRLLGTAAHAVAIGEHMRRPAEALAERAGVPVAVIANATGLAGADELAALFARLSGRPAPARVLRDRSRLVDAMLDAHFHFGGKKVAVAGEPDLVLAVSSLCAGLGARVTSAVAATGASPALAAVPADAVMVGDLGLFEERAAADDADLLIANSHADMAAERLGKPHFRLGFPIVDRLGSQHFPTIGYAGTMRLVFALAQQFQGALHRATPESLDPFPTPSATQRSAS